MNYSAEKMEAFVALLDKHAPQEGLNVTNIPGVGMFRQTDTPDKCSLVYEPSIVILGKGKKQCFVNGRKYDYSAGNYLTLFFTHAN